MITENEIRDKIEKEFKDHENIESIASFNTNGIDIILEFKTPSMFGKYTYKTVGVECKGGQIYKNLHLLFKALGQCIYYFHQSEYPLDIICLAVPKPATPFEERKLVWLKEVLAYYKDLPIILYEVP